MIHTYIYTYIHTDRQTDIHADIHTQQIYTFIHHWHCFQNRFKHPCSRTCFFLRKQSWNVNVLRKVVKKFKCKCKIFGPFFSKYKFFEVKTFFPLSTHPINSFFSAVISIYKILVIDEAFFPFATITRKSEKLSFSCFLVKLWKKFI